MLKLAIILILFLCGCAIPIKLIPAENPKSLKYTWMLEKIKSKLNRKIQEKDEQKKQRKSNFGFTGERFLLYQALFRTDLNKFLKRYFFNFRLASSINSYYDTIVHPTRKGYYDYLRKELKGYFIVKDGQVIEKQGLRDDIIEDLINETEQHYQLLKKINE